MSNKNETSSTTPDSDDSLGIIFNEIKLPDPTNTAYIAPTSPTSNTTPLKNFSTTVSGKTPETSFLDGGTIITDRRKKRATIKDNLNAAFTEWWGNTKKKLETTFEVIEKTINEPKVEEPVIQNVEARIETIKEAASYTAQAPKDDHKNTVEKIATVRADSEPITVKPIIIKEASKPVQGMSGWSHLVEEPEMIMPTPEPITSHTESPDEVPSSGPESIIAPVVNLSDIKTLNTPLGKVSHEEASIISPEKLEEILPGITRSRAKTDSVPLENISAEEVSPSLEKNAEQVFPPVDISPVETFQAPQPAVESEKVSTPSSETPEEIVPGVSFETNVTRSVEEEVPQPEELPIGEPITVEPAPEISFEPPVVQIPSVREVVSPIPTRSLHSTASLSEAERTFFTKKSVSAQPTSFADVSQNNTIRIVIKGLLILVIVLAGIFLALFASSRFSPFESSPTTQVDAIPVVIPQIFKTDSQTAIPLSPSKATFLAELTTTIENAPQGVSQFYPIVTTETERHAGSAKEIFTLLDTHFSTQLINVLEDTVIIGSVTAPKNEPFIVMQSFNFDVLFSGLLAAEQYLHADLSPLFGVSDAPSNGFTDMVIQNKSTRMLKDTEGNIIFLYAFVNQNTVIMTTTEAALVSILNRL